MGTILAVANAKGGTGKTTLAVNLACALGTRHTARLVDADDQLAAAAWMGHAEAPVPARRHLMDDSSVPDAATCRQWIEPVRTAAESCSYLVIDLPPRLNTVVATAFALADLVVVPVTPGGTEIRATRRCVEAVRRARASRGGPLPDCVLVPNRVDRRTTVGRALEHELREMGEAVGPTLRQRAAHMTAFNAGTWAGDHTGGGEAAREIEALVKFLRQRLGHAPGRKPASAAVHRAAGETGA